MQNIPGFSIIWIMTYKEWVENFDKQYISVWYNTVFIRYFNKIQNQELFYNSKVFTRCSNINTKKLEYYHDNQKMSYWSLEELKELYYINCQIWKYEKMLKKLDRIKEDFEIRT